MLKPGTKHAPLPADAGDASIARLDNLRNAKGNLRTAEIRRSMQKIMQNNAAVFRTQATLAEGVGLIDECVETFADVKVRVGGSLDRVSKLVIFIRPSCSRFLSSVPRPYHQPRFTSLPHDIRSRIAA